MAVLVAAVKAMRWGRGPAVVVLNRPPGPSLDPYKRKSHKYKETYCFPFLPLSSFSIMVIHSKVASVVAITEFIIG